MPSSKDLKDLVHRELEFAAKTRYMKSIGDEFQISSKPFDLGTCSFNAIEKNFCDVDEACRRLSLLYDKRVQCNAYFTPKGAQGLPVHYDLHDVLVVQIEGEKKWNIWPRFRNSVSVQTLQLDEKENIRNWTLTQSPCVLMLVKGDCLHLTAGEPHMAYAIDEDSLHLSFGIYHE